MAASARPLQAKAYALLLAAGGVAMGFLGLMASGYFVPAACLMLQAGLVWFGRGLRLVTAIAWISALSGTVVVLALWLGGPLGALKLDISGAALLANLAAGGPPMALLALPLMASMRPGRALTAWFGARRA